MLATLGRNASGGRSAAPDQKLPNRINTWPRALPSLALSRLAFPLTPVQVGVNGFFRLAAADGTPRFRARARARAPRRRGQCVAPAVGPSARSPRACQDSSLLDDQTRPRPLLRPRPARTGQSQQLLLVARFRRHVAARLLLTNHTSSRREDIASAEDNRFSGETRRLNARGFGRSEDRRENAVAAPGRLGRLRSAALCSRRQPAGLGSRGGHHLGQGTFARLAGGASRIPQLTPDHQGNSCARSSTRWRLIGINSRSSRLRRQHGTSSQSSHLAKLSWIS